MLSDSINSMLDSTRCSPFSSTITLFHLCVVKLSAGRSQDELVQLPIKMTSVVECYDVGVQSMTSYNSVSVVVFRCSFDGGDGIGDVDGGSTAQGGVVAWSRNV